MSYGTFPCEREECEQMVYGDTGLCVSITIIDVSKRHGEQETQYCFCSVDCAREFIKDFQYHQASSS